MRYLAIPLASLALLASSAALAGDEHCATVAGRYSIYADGDRLHIDASHHFLNVVIDALDEQLEKADWEKAAAYGQFTICYQRAVSPLQLTIKDVVRVKRYAHMRIVRH